MTPKLSVEDVLISSIRALELALERARAATTGPLARFAELPPFIPGSLVGVRIARHRTRAALRCSCGWECNDVKQASYHAYVQPFNDGKVHMIEGQWIHHFQMRMSRRNWWNA